MTMERLRKGKLVGDEKLSSDELDILLGVEEEYARRGHFTRVYPDEEAFGQVDDFFEAKRYQNLLVQRYLQSPSGVRNLLLKDYPRVPDLLN